MHLQAAVVAHMKLMPAAASFASELATQLRCERVSVGFVDRRFTQIVAISHGGSPTAEAEVLNALGSAMDEAIEQRATVRFPQLPDTALHIVLAHQALHRSQGNALCTIPLVADGRILGAVLFEFRDPQLFTRERIIECEHLVSLIGPVLELMRRNELPWSRRLAEGVKDAWTALRSPEKRALRWLLLGLAIALVGLVFLPIHHNIGGQARIEGAIQRVLVAPADGFLKKNLVRPGDHVTAGQVLVEMAEQDLQIEHRKWSSELAQHENAYAAALARADRAQLVINQAKADEARAQLELVEQQLGRSRIEAPFSGIVIKGDLSQSLGAPVKRGEPLLTLAPADAFRVIVEVDERDIANVRVGQAGRVALSALPWDTLPIRITRITPMASAVEGANVFDVEAAIDAPPGILRPGLQGVARIDAGRRPLLWNWTHRGIEWLALKFWGWWGT